MAATQVPPRPETGNIPAAFAYLNDAGETVTPKEIYNAWCEASEILSALKWLSESVIAHTSSEYIEISRARIILLSITAAGKALNCLCPNINEYERLGLTKEAAQ